MDFMERLCDKINTISDLDVTCKMGYLGTDESLVIYPLPGSKVVWEYMDGTSDQRLNFEIAMKSKSQQNIHDTLWKIQNMLENLDELESENDSFEFDEIIIVDKPFINQLEKQLWFIFLLDIQAKITVFKNNKEDKNNG